MPGLFKLGWQDLVKGAVVSVLASVLTIVLDILNTGASLDWKVVGTVALTSFVSYLLKNLGTDSNGKLGGKI